MTRREALNTITTLRKHYQGKPFPYALLASGRDYAIRHLPTKTDFASPKEATRFDANLTKRHGTAKNK